MTKALQCKAWWRDRADLNNLVVSATDDRIFGLVYECVEEDINMLITFEVRSLLDSGLWQER